MAAESSDYSLENIEWLLDEKKWEEMVDKCDEGILTAGKDKVDPKYFYYRAKGNYETGDHTECLTDLRSVIYRADVSNSLKVDALVLKGECLFALEEYESCKQTIKAAFAQRSDPAFYKLVNKCNEKLGLTVEKAPVKEKEKVKEKDKEQESDKEKEKEDAPAAAPKKFRYDWYQSDTDIVISILIKKVNRDDLTYQFKESHISIEVRLPDDESFILNTELFDKIKFYESKVTVLATKIEVRLKKASPISWKKLEKDKSQSDSEPSVKNFTSQDTAPSTQDPQKFPTSARTPTDWDKLAAQVTKEEAEEKPEGDAALNKFFQQIYGGGTDEQKKAMMKSFQESGGTVLSTNWDDVKKDKVEMKSPDGMEFKKYEI